MRFLLAILSVGITLLCVEGLRFVPSLIPPQVAAFMGSHADVVERLDHSPFVKFKSNTFIRGADRGPDFVREWTTDNLGFKNRPGIDPQIVAVGDSFTEGMGVATEQTWCSLLVVCYNLGVQGYSPAQIEGAWNEYGKRLHPRTVIVGYTATTHDRIAPTDMASARELRDTTESVVVALYRLARSIPVRGSRIAEEQDAARRPWDDPPTFTAALEAFGRIGGVLIYFPSRGEISMPADSARYQAVEAARMNAFAKAHDMTFIDMTPSLRGNLNAFLSTDGHLSAEGNRLVASVISQRLGLR